jgi:class 3 adenylate cyclase
VNVAARLQAQAEAGELVLPGDLGDAAAAGGWLAGARIVERYRATLKGVRGTLPAIRVRSNTAPERKLGT